MKAQEPGQASAITKQSIERAAWVLWDEVGDGISDREPFATFKVIAQKMLRAAHRETGRSRRVSEMSEGL